MMRHEVFLLLAMVFTAPHLPKRAGLIMAAAAFACAAVVAAGAP